MFEFLPSVPAIFFDHLCDFTNNSHSFVAKIYRKTLRSYCRKEAIIGRIKVESSGLRKVDLLEFRNANAIPDHFCIGELVLGSGSKGCLIKKAQKRLCARR